MTKISERLARQHFHRTQAALVAELSRKVRQALLKAATAAGFEESTDCAALTVERAPAPVAPARMAASHPGNEADRQQARRRYEVCLEHYRSVVRAQDAHREGDDVGTAVALFVTANIQALRQVAVTPDILARLARQLTGVVRSTSAWATAPTRERQFYFEQMAILSVLIGTTTKHAAAQGEAAIANVQRSARGYLQALLGLNPDALSLGAEGLRLVQQQANAVAERA
jgi:hypothetical protein